MRLCCSLLLAVQALAFQTPASVAAGVVEGRVVDSATGAPLAAVRVTLAQIPIVMGIRPASGPRGLLGEDFYDPTLMPAQRVAEATPAVVNTGVDGQFRMTLNPGRYQVRAERQGFFATPAGVGSLSLIPGETLKGVTIKLTQHASISGRIVDGEGIPMAQVRVQGLRWTTLGAGGQRIFAVQSSTVTGDQGEYRMAGLTPGKYILSAESFHVTQFAPGVTDPAAAQAIDLAPGASRANIDFRLRRVPGFNVRGKVTGGAPNSGVIVSLLPRNPSTLMAPPHFTQAKPDGSFELPNVPPGAYRISATGAAGEHQPVTLSGHAKLDVAESDVDGVTVTLRAGVRLEGQVRVAGASAGQAAVLGTISLWLQPPPGSFSGTAHSPVDAAGRFRFASLDAASYRFQAVGLPRGYFTKSIQLNGVEVPPDALQPIENGEMTITLERGTAELSGKVLYPNQQPASDVQVMVLNVRGEIIGSAVSLIDGQYRLTELPPGTYRIFPVVDADISDASTLDRLSATATVITFEKSARETRDLEVR